MSSFLIIGEYGPGSWDLRKLLPAPVVQIPGYPDAARLGSLLAGCTAVFLCPATPEEAADWAASLLLHDRTLRVCAVGKDWDERAQQSVLEAGATSCIAAPVLPEVLENVLSWAPASRKSNVLPFPAIQYFHGNAGRHLGLFGEVRT